MKKIFILAIVLSLVYAGVFIIPGSFDKFALDPEKVYKGEFWRFITYPFVHLNIAHLLENIGGLFLVCFIANELKTLFSDFSMTYISSGFFAVIPLWIVMQFIALGASTAVYSGFGLISLETSRYNIKPLFVIMGFSFITFIKSIIDGVSFGVSEEFLAAFSQDLAHFSGFLFGIMFFLGLGLVKALLAKRKTNILRRFA
jgi:membrane associated rhomboid family serine protease